MSIQKLSSIKSVLPILWIIVFGQVFLTGIVFAQDDPLVEMVEGVAEEMKGKIGQSSVYFDVKEFKHAVTGEIPILSIRLYNHLQAALARVGFTMAENTAVARYLIKCDFQTTDENVDFFFKYCKVETPEQFQIINANIKFHRLPDDTFNENLETKALKIASALLNNPAAYRRLVSGSSRLKIFVNPIVESKHKYQSEFSEHFLNRIRSQLVKSDFIEVVEPKPIRSRSLQRVKKQSSQVKELNASDAVLANADAVLDGVYYVAQDHVSVSLRVRSADGTLLGNVDEDLPKAMISFELDNPVAEKAAVMADVGSQENMDSHVKITTDKGDAYQTYFKNELITFIIQVTDPLYVYVYSIGTDNKVNRIYPEDDTAHAITPGELYTIPPMDADWEIAVMPPFGLDNVVVFASDRPLPLPRISEQISSVSLRGDTKSLVRKEKKIALARKKEINPLDLVEYYRGAALLRNTKLYEDNIMITTKER